MDGSQRNWVTNPSKTGEKNQSKCHNKKCSLRAAALWREGSAEKHPGNAEQKWRKTFFSPFLWFGCSHEKPRKRLFLSVCGWSRGPRVSGNTCRVFHWHKFFLKLLLFFLWWPFYFFNHRWSIVISALFAWRSPRKPLRFFCTVDFSVSKQLTSSQSCATLCGFIISRWLS